MLECLTRLWDPFIKNFVRAGIIKLIMTLSQTRNLKVILGAFSSDIPRFATIFGIAAALFHLILCVFKRFGKRQSSNWLFKMRNQQVCFFAAFFAALPLALGLQPREVNVLKMLFFPMLFRCMCDKALES